ncbi:hypothetical protein [Mesorhizobium xinjiangense]|nr:hypothetical protein [Mesorhizobium xinjiangense]
MTQRNWIILAAVIVVLLIGYAVWPSGEEPATTGDATTTEESTD